MDVATFVERVAALSGSRRDPGERATRAPPSAAEQIEDEIKKLMFAGELAPGVRLGEVELANRFGVSRAPIRDALRSLDKQGFVELSPRRGAVVFEPTPADVNNLYEVRAELGALASRKAASAMDGQTKALAREGVALILRLGADSETSPDDYLRVRTGLTELIIVAANNPRLTAVAGALGMEAITHTRVFHSAEHRRRNSEGWRRLYQAIFDHDGELAANEARKLTLESRDELLRQMREDAARPG